jgi:drug/metabolite transporter (DMT)-like permease
MAGSESGVLTSDYAVGVGLAVSSSLFIGSSFIVKKKGLRGAAGARAGSGGFSYLLNPLWWLGLSMMVVGEVANFVAYSYAPAIVVTPMGALSVVISAVLASLLLGEHLEVLGKLGCTLCLVGSTVIVLHAPAEHQVTSLEQLWGNIAEPGFLVYLVAVLGCSAVLIVHYVPRYGTTNILVYLLVCSLLGSLSVMSCKAVGMALRLTLESGDSNQLLRPGTWVLVAVMVCCIATQMNYLNKSLDLFNTAKVTPIYYVLFTTFVIAASVILFKDWRGVSPTSVVSQVCGFLTVFIGVFILQENSTDEYPTGSSKGDRLSSPASHGFVKVAATDDDDDDEKEGGGDGDDDDDENDVAGDTENSAAEP